jgi:plastocyanin
MKKKIMIIITAIPAIIAMTGVFVSCAPAGGELTDMQDEVIEEEIPEQTAGAMAEVIMEDSLYQPQILTVSQGTTVTWINNGGIIHTVVSGTRGSADAGNMFDSGNIGTGEKFSYTFEEQGEYPYFCDLHPGMDGTIIVE